MSKLDNEEIIVFSEFVFELIIKDKPHEMILFKMEILQIYLNYLAYLVDSIY